MSAAVWSTVASAAAAVGTLILAFFTWRLARSTSRQANLTQQTIALASDELTATREQVEASERQVDVSQRQADVARQAFQASLRPLLTDVPGKTPEVLFGGDGAPGPTVRLPLRNIGPGTALITGLSVATGDCSWVGKMTNAVIPPGEETRLEFVIPMDHPELQPLLGAIGAGSLDVWGSYTDVAGTQTFRSRANLRDDGANGWRVRQVFFHLGDSAEPFAASGPSDA